MQNWEKDQTPGRVVLFGSGETSPNGRKIFEEIFRFLPAHPMITLLETPAGFELNSHKIAAKISEFFEYSLQNYDPQIEILPARKKGSDLSPDNPEIVLPILYSDMIFMGPGSPTYTVRQLQDSLAWEYILARNSFGAVLALASSAVIAISSYALPVYEIFKVGTDLSWNPGLDFFTGMNRVFIPHWNNQDGGSGLDTSCCFMGKTRFAELLELLPLDATIIAIDEQTALLFDFKESCCQVLGKGKVTVIHPETGTEAGESEFLDKSIERVVQKRNNRIDTYQSKITVPMDRFLPNEFFEANRQIPIPVWLKAHEANKEIEQARASSISREPISRDSTDLPREILNLLNEREQSRKQKDWETSDKIRDTCNELGWDVMDTLDGQKVVRRKHHLN